VIGIQYVVTSFFFMLVGGLLAMLVRAELAAPGMQFVDANAYNGLFSVHASLMIFLFIIPVFAGLANFVLPLMIGAPDMAFPRLNALSFWMLPLGGLMMTASFLAPGGSFATGWTAYAPLSTDVPIGQLFFTIGVQFAGASSIATALNFLVTIITMRAPGMSFWRMPLLVWANFSTSLLVVIATPFVAASQFFVLLDYALGFNFFNRRGRRRADVPARLLVLLAPGGLHHDAAGLRDRLEILSVKSRKPIFGYRMMAFSLLAIVLLGFTVWAHHMFVSGMQSWIRIPMMVTTAIIAVPTGIKIFSWLATLWRGVLHLDTPMLFVARLPDDVHARRHLGRDARDGAADDPRLGHLLHRRPHPLRAVRRLAVHDLRGRLLLVPEDDGPDVRRDARQDPLLADVRRLQPDLRADARDRRPGHAAARRRLPGAVRGWNLFISIASFGLGLSTLIFVYNIVSRGAAARARRPTRGARSRSSGRSPRPRRSSTSTTSRPSSAARTSTASPARCTDLPPRGGGARTRAASRAGR
jgi:cytochrome c oxidase subunit 1